MNRLAQGFLKFKSDVFPAKRSLFRALAGGQSPHTLFITCADSRIVPTLVMQAEPGELFVCRTVGNQVPAYGLCAGHAVASSVEFAVQVLGVAHVVICGHTDCGAMKAILHPEKLSALPSTAAWLKTAEAARAVVAHNYKDATDEVRLHLLTEENVLTQLENLKTHPAVAARLAAGDLELHAWVFHIHSGEIYAYNSRHATFYPLGREHSNAEVA